MFQFNIEPWFFVPKTKSRRKIMAKIIENSKGRRNIRLNTDDIINIVREYQLISSFGTSYEQLRERLDSVEFYLPEDIN